MLPSQNDKQATRRLMGEVLFDLGVITKDQVNIALQAQRHLQSTGVSKRFGDILQDYAFASQRDIERAMRDHSNSTMVEFPSDFPLHIVNECQVKLIGIVGNKAIVGAFRPLRKYESELIIAQLKIMSYAQVTEVVVKPADRVEVLTFIRKHSDIGTNALAGLLARLNHNVAEVYDLGLVMRALFFDAIQDGASDVHMDRVSDPMHCKIQYRINGDLSVNQSHYHMLTPEAMASLVTRIKLDAAMDPSDMHHPQDGRMSYEFRGRNIDLRVASHPISGGETLTIRLLDPSALQPLARLYAYHEPILEKMKGMTTLRGKPVGLMIVSGPTGSGKTTTLNSTVREMPRLNLKIMTAEDPVEIAIAHVRQTSVNDKMGVGYDEILRSQMRHDVDVLLVGEIRDSRTAEKALRSAESGHFVMTTLHTHNVAHTISRIVAFVPGEYRESGLYTMAQTLSTVINQRLVRRLCSCSVPISIEELAASMVDVADELKIDSTFTPRKKVGCHRCRGTGYIGRVVAPEAAFFPNIASVRHEMEQILLFPKNEPASILNIKGVEVYSRIDAVRSLIRRGITDADEGLSVLDRGFIERVIP